MHSVNATTEQMIRSVLAYAENRLRLDPVPLDKGSRDPAELEAVLAGLLSEEGHTAQGKLARIYQGQPREPGTHLVRDRRRRDARREHGEPAGVLPQPESA